MDCQKIVVSGVQMDATTTSGMLAVQSGMQKSVKVQT